MSLPSTLSDTKRMGVMSGTLGSLAVSGQSWMVLARVAHLAGFGHT